MSSDRDQVSSCTIDKENDIITDRSEILPAFCQSLEALLRKGIKKGLGVTGLVDRDYWNCIEGLVSSRKVVTSVPLTISHTICLVQQNKRATTSLSRGRLFLRIALNKGLLTEVLQCLMDNQDYVRYWYKDSSPLVNMKDRAFMMDTIKALKKKNYKLNTKNCSFLNEAWILPEMVEYEFIPCAMIGVTLYSLDGKCIILEVQPGSAADERGILPGDCLDELYGQVIDDKWSLKISQLKRKNQGKPVTAVFLKGRYSDGRWFAPIYQRYRRLCGVGKCSMVEQPKPNHIDVNKPGLSDHDKMTIQHKFTAKYVGATDVGKRGNCSYVQNGITKILQSQQDLNEEPEDVLIQLMERDILVTSTSNNEKVIGRFSYTETSSCALKNDNPLYFGFITGDTTCSFAENFQCHVFKCNHPSVARTIIEGIGKGFDRTVYCV